MLKDAKYLLAYVAPLAAYLGIYVGGAWSFGSIYVGFVLIPLLEFLLPGSSRNLTPEEEGRKSEAHAFDLLLYLNVPVLFGLLWYYYRTLAAGGSTGLEITGMTFSVGLIVGTIGINVAHELGHRQTAHEPFLAKLLLMTGLYMHFIIEHNRGHHRWVATPAASGITMNITTDVTSVPQGTVMSVTPSRSPASGAKTKTMMRSLSETWTSV